MNTVVKTRQGEVRGRRADGVHVFKGIPYASPPFGAHRLRPPQPVEPWSGVRGAMAFGRKSPQPSYPPPLRLLLPELADPGEDCLTLNNWSPDLVGPAAGDGLGFRWHVRVSRNRCVALV
jgi:carboxylesterase type B